MSYGIQIGEYTYSDSGYASLFAHVPLTNVTTTQTYWLAGNALAIPSISSTGVDYMVYNTSQSINITQLNSRMLSSSAFNGTSTQITLTTPVINSTGWNGPNPNTFFTMNVSSSNIIQAYQAQVESDSYGMYVKTNNGLVFDQNYENYSRHSSGSATSSVVTEVWLNGPGSYFNIATCITFGPFIKPPLIFVGNLSGYLSFHSYVTDAEGKYIGARLISRTQPNEPNLWESCTFDYDLYVHYSEIPVPEHGIAVYKPNNGGIAFHSGGRVLLARAAGETLNIPTVWQTSNGTARNYGVAKYLTYENSTDYVSAFATTKVLINTLSYSRGVVYFVSTYLPGDWQFCGTVIHGDYLSLYFGTFQVSRQPCFRGFISVYSYNATVYGNVEFDTNYKVNTLVAVAWGSG
jgi:hypothetical protein